LLLAWISEEEPLGREEFRGKGGYFYANGPEYSLEYIHDRVEDWVIVVVCSFVISNHMLLHNHLRY